MEVIDNKYKVIKKIQEIKNKASINLVQRIEDG